MGNAKKYALAGILALAASTTAHAADLLPPPPPPPLAPAVEVGAGWYLRGDIGMTNQNIDKLSFVPKDVATAHGVGDETFEKVHMDFDSSPFGGLGVGYQFNNWIRADFTDVDAGVGSVAFAGDHSETDLAWAVHAGVAYDVLPNFKVEFAYRYLN